MNTNKFVASFLLLFLSYSTFAQNNNDITALGLPGDNLNLYAVLDEFQKSPSIEQFERSINDQSKNINNLDLNYDNQVDYINVQSYKDGRDYSIVLQVAVNANQMQDLAVIEVNKTSTNDVIIQLIGNEDLYGNNYIIEPSNYNNGGVTYNPGYRGNNQNNNSSYRYNNTPYFVNTWPVIIYLFSPSYVNYYSPWYWNNYPRYWRPWRSIYYANYWSYNRHYYNNNRYHRCNNLRYPIHSNYYNNHRQRSNIVSKHRTNGNYNKTYNGKTYSKPTEHIQNIPSVRNTHVSANEKLQINSRTTIKDVKENEISPSRDDIRQISPVNNQRVVATRNIETVNRKPRQQITPREMPTRNIETVNRESRQKITPREMPTRNIETVNRESRQQITPREMPTRNIETVNRESRQKITPREMPTRNIETNQRQASINQKGADTRNKPAERRK